MTMNLKLNSEYWQNRYKTDEIGWDTGAITTPLKEYIDQLNDKSISILIPGCGNSYEYEYLLRKGFTNVTVLDYAQVPIENIKKRIPNCNIDQLICEDFFEHDKHYDLILEQTFFCALDPTLRYKYAQKMYSLLSNNGKLVGLFFQFLLTEQGPPFGGSKEEYLTLFSDLFKIKVLETAYNSIRPRQNRELFFIFTKK
jgi:methyl halide transferase